MEKTKVCRHCKLELPLSNFSFAKECTDQRQSTCKRCVRLKRDKRLGRPIKEYPETITCPVCGRNLPSTSFKLDRRTPIGLRWLCQECEDKHNEINKGKNRNYFRTLRIQVDPEYAEYIRGLRRINSKKHVEQHMLAGCRTRARKKELEFNLTLEDIVIPEKCPILEVPFVLGDKFNYEFSPSIDRIDNSKGYVKGNIQIISMKANTMKNSATLEELKLFCKNILRYSPTNTEEESVEVVDKEPPR